MITDFLNFAPNISKKFRFLFGIFRKKSLISENNIFKSPVQIFQSFSLSFTCKVNLIYNLGLVSHWRKEKYCMIFCDCKTVNGRFFVRCKCSHNFEITNWKNCSYEKISLARKSQKKRSQTLITCRINPLKKTEEYV